MAENNNQNNPQQIPPQRRINLPMIIMIVLIIGLLAIGIFSFFGDFGVTTFSVSSFTETALNNPNYYVMQIEVAPNDNTYVTIHGQLYFTNLDYPSGATQSFKVTMSMVTYFEQEHPFAEKDFSATSFDSDEMKLTTYSQRLQAEVQRTHYSALPEAIKNSTFYNESDSYYVVTFWDQLLSLLPTIILYGLILVAGFFILSRIMRQVGRDNTQAMSFNQSRARKVLKSSVRYSDVAGCDEEKAELEEVVEYLKNPQKFTAFGAKLPRGILLVGPPGTGKTLLAKATAGEAGVPFFSISGSDFVEMFVGVGAGRVRDMFKVAKSNAPCIVFIDEIDAVGRQRGAGLGGGNDEREQTLNQLLVEMDGFSDNQGIVVIAATNREDVLDPALLRAGRFDRQITVSLPDRAGREAIFRVHARRKTFAPDVDFAQISKRTIGFSGADIENILNEAAILALRQKKTEIDMRDIDEAIDRRFAGPAKKSRGMSEQERKIAAYHESGHAIIGLNVPNSDVVHRITIVPRGNTGGHVLMTPEDDRFMWTKKQLISRIIGYLGGRSSEEVFFDDITTGAQQDIEVATRIARLMVTEFGMSSLGPIQYERDSSSVFLGRDYNSTQKNFSSSVADQIDMEIRKIIDDAHKTAVETIKKHKADVILVAETLLENETITEEQISYLLKHRQLPKNGESTAVVAVAKEKNSAPKTKRAAPKKAETVVAEKASDKTE